MHVNGLSVAGHLLAQLECEEWNLIILNFAILISLFTQPIKFSDGQLVLSCSLHPPLFLIRQYYSRLSF